MKAYEILQTGSLVIEDRQREYGTPRDNMRRTAMLLSAYLEIPIDDYQASVILALVKIARTVEDHSKLDTWIDLAAYSAIAGELAVTEDELYV